MSTVNIVTETGSTYRTRCVGDGWELWADHVQHPDGTDIRGRWWPILPPFGARSEAWPPEVGEPAVLLCVHYRARLHPDRMPGGGKVTSHITEVHHV